MRACVLAVVAISLLGIGCNMTIWDILYPERYGCCASTVRFKDAETGEPIVGAVVEWWGANTDDDLGGLSPDEYLDEVGVVIGITNAKGWVFYPVCGIMDALDFVNFDFEPDFSINYCRLDTGERTYTVVIGPADLQTATDGLLVTIRGWVCQGDWRQWTDVVEDKNEMP